MGETITFMHAADIHLGAPFLGLRSYSDAWARRMAAAIPEAFGRMIDTAIEKRIDFLVLAGDIFDLALPSFADYACFLDGMQRLAAAGIPVYCCTGNHDPYISWQQRYGKLPDNVFMFPAGDAAGYFLYERDGAPLALIGGRGFYNRNWPHDMDIAQGITRAAGQEALGVAPPFAVGVLHTGLDIDSSKAPTSPAALIASDMDYWALGHVHVPLSWRDGGGNVRAAFSGCVQGRKMRDTGARGANLVTLSSGKPNKIAFVPCASVVWERVCLDVSACGTLAEIVDAACDELIRLNAAASCDEMIERVTLQGTTPLHELLQQPGVCEDIRARINGRCARFFCDAVLDETRAPHDIAKMREEGLFPAVFLESCERNASDSAAAIAYLQQSFIDSGMGVVDVPPEALSRLQGNAERLVLDLLDGKGGVS